MSAQSPLHLVGRSGRLAAGVGMVVLAALLYAASPANAGPSIHTAVRTPLPTDRLHFGLGNQPADLGWMTGTGVPWRYRYAYLSGGINTGGGNADPNCGANVGWQTYNTPAGAYATFYMQDSAANNMIPVFSYYEIVQSNPSIGNESAETTKINTLCTMQRYWADFTVLMQKAGAFGGQVVVQVEPDFWGFMERANTDPRAIPALVVSTGNPSKGASAT